MYALYLITSTLSLILCIYEKIIFNKKIQLYNRFKNKYSNEFFDKEFRDIASIYTISVVKNYIIATIMILFIIFKEYPSIAFILSSSSLILTIYSVASIINNKSRVDNVSNLYKNEIILLTRKIHQKA